MKTVFFIFTLVLLLDSCKENQDNVTIDNDVILTVQNEAGNDLLNPSNAGAYLAKDIKIYYLVNGERKEVYNANYDDPRNFSIYEQDGKYQMRLGLMGSEDFGTTYVEWNANDVDTFKNEVSRTVGSMRCEKLWYNDVLVWTSDNYTKERSFAIVK